MEVITTESFVTPLKGFLMLPPTTQEKKSGTMYCKLDDKPRLYAIGSIKRVNQNIARFEMGLKRIDRSDVVIKDIELKRQSIQKDARKSPLGSRGKDKDQKVIQKPGMWLSDPKVPHHGKIAHKKLVSEKDKLVELYQYPGYNKEEVTPLPNGIELEDILEKVIRAQRKTPIGKTRWSVKMLRKFLHAPCIRAFLLDSFWWLFLHLYHPDREVQGHLFERIAENYSRILLGCHRVSNQENILDYFPSLLSQAVYTCFCYCFSRSWFNTYEFKAQLCDVFSEWLGGTLHAPGSFNKWDYSQLEPERSRREDLLSGKGPLASEVTFDSHKTSVDVPRTPLQLQKKRMSLKKAINKPGKGIQKPVSRKNDQLSPSLKEEACLLFQFCPEPCDDTPREDDLDSLNKQRSTPKKKLKIALLPRESHPACPGPEFTWHCLNISGHSPLIQHFLQKKHVEPKTGCDIFMPRREICKPIPDSAQTYADVIKQGFHILQQRRKTFSKAYLRHCREMRNFDQQYLENQELARQEMHEEMKRRQAEKKSCSLFPQKD